MKMKVFSLSCVMVLLLAGSSMAIEPYQPGPVARPSPDFLLHIATVVEMGGIEKYTEATAPRSWSNTWIDDRDDFSIHDSYNTDNSQMSSFEETITDNRDQSYKDNSTQTTTQTTLTTSKTNVKNTNYESGSQHYDVKTNVNANMGPGSNLANIPTGSSETYNSGSGGKTETNVNANMGSGSQLGANTTGSNTNNNFEAGSSQTTVETHANMGDGSILSQSTIGSEMTQSNVDATMGDNSNLSNTIINP